MGLFSRKAKEPSDNADTRVYAFIGLGMMARFMSDKQLEAFIKAMPAMIAHECGTSPDNIVLVHGVDWAPKGSDFANAVNFDGTPAFPNEALKLCETYLRSKGLHKHLVGDQQLLGVLEDGKLSLGTYNDLKLKDTKIIGVSILLSAWLAFHRSTIKA